MIAIYNIIKSFSIVKIWNNLTQYSLKPFMSVFNTVRKLREQRYGIVSSLEQYKYIYDFCIEWYRRNFFSRNILNNQKAREN
jgi:protein tyrosine phosphatase